MKIKKVESICKSDKRITILEGEGAQWLGNGNAMYLLDGMPVLDESTIFTLFDVAEKDREKYYLKCEPLPAGYNFGDTDDSEYLIDRIPIALSYLGYTVIPYRSEVGTIFIESRYLAPLHKIEGGYELYLRYNENKVPYVAVKSGLLILAIIYPCNYALFSKGLSFVDFIDNISSQTNVALEYYKEVFPCTFEENTHDIGETE